MPRVPVPPEIDAFLAQPNPAIVGTVRPDGAPHTAATWYDWEDGRVLLNMEDTRVRLGYMRANPQVSGKARRSTAPFPPTQGTRQSNASPATCPGTKLVSSWRTILCRAISRR